MKRIIFATILGLATFGIFSCKKDNTQIFPVVGFEVKDVMASVYTDKFTINIIAKISTDQVIGINKAMSIDDFGLFSDQDKDLGYYIKSVKINGVDLKYDEVYFTLENSENLMEYTVEFQKQENDSALFWIEMTKFSYLYEGELYKKVFENSLVSEKFIFE